MERAPSIIIVDDDADVALIEDGLRRAGIAHGFYRCRDGAEALEFFEQSSDLKPMLVVLDLQMPRVNGIEVLRRLKSNAQWSHLPVVMLTSSEDDSLIEQCYELGCMGCVRKPSGVEGFDATIRTIGLFAELLWERDGSRLRI